MFEMAGEIDVIDNRVIRHLIRACNVKTECSLEHINLISCITIM